MALLNIKNLSKQLTGGLLIDNISLQVEQLQKVAIAGASGAGKTTLLKMIASHTQPDSGSIFFNDEKVWGPNDKLLPGHKGIAYLSQHYELLNNYRVEELIWFENRLDIDEATTLFEICRINHLLKRRTDQLSGGEKQRIALCLLLVKCPVVLVLDEPFSNLDPMHTQTLKQVLEDVTERLKVTCILTSHQPEDTLAWADEILVLQEGKLVQQGTPQTIYHQPANEYVAALFGSYHLLSPAQAALLMHSGSSKGDKQMLVRPEQILATTASDGVRGSVHAVRFKGSHYEVEVHINQLRLKMTTTNPLHQKGHTIYVKIKPGKHWFI